MEITVTSTDETKRLAEQLAKKLTPGDVLALYGDLGSGKTTFASYIVGALGLNTRVQSPTFVIIRDYQNADLPSDIRRVLHIDLYRLTTIEEVEDLGLEEMMKSPNTITVIEWPEIWEGRLPENVYKIKFEYLGENSRKIYVQN